MNDRLHPLAALRFMRFIVEAPLGIERFALSVERSRYSLS